MKEKIEILESKPFGYIVLNHTRKIKQILPGEYIKKRLAWGLYELINGSQFNLA